LTVNCQLSTALLAQQPTTTAPNFRTNAQWVQGIGPGYRPTAGSGLTLNIAAGTAYCGDPPVAVFYAGGTLTLTASQTNYVYLDPAATCAPAFNITGFAVGQIPLAKVVTGASTISSVTDVRSWFVPLPCVMSVAGAIRCSTLGDASQGFTVSPGIYGNFNLDFGGNTFTINRYAVSGAFEFSSFQHKGYVFTDASVIMPINVVTFSATPTFDASLGNTQKITLTDNVTSSTLSNASTGQTINFIICQDATGGRTFVWPTNVLFPSGASTAIGATASKCSTLLTVFDGTNALVFGGLNINE
jgi:hypothetical protein